MLKFLKSLFKKNGSSPSTSDEEYLDFNDYTDVSIDLKNIHTRKSSKLNLKPKIEEKIIADIIPKIDPEFKATPKEDKEFATNSRIIFVDEKEETEVNTRDFARLGELLKKESNSKGVDSFEKSQLVLQKKRDDFTIKKSPKQRRNVVTNTNIHSSQTMSKTYETVNFKMDGPENKKSKKSLYLLILSLLGLITLFILLNSDSEDPEVTSETTQDRVEELTQTSKPKPKVIRHKINYKSSGAGLVYSCSAKHWACVDNKNFKKCKLSSKQKVCIGVKVYKSKKGCQRVQQKAINLNKKLKSCL